LISTRANIQPSALAVPFGKMPLKGDVLSAGCEYCLFKSLINDFGTWFKNLFSQA
jgi:hypothetical protein